MKRFLLCLPLIAALGCAGPFDTCVKPYASQITFTGTVTELGEIVGIFLECDPTFSAGEAPVCALEELNVLEGQLGPNGKAIVDCVVAWYEKAGTAKQRSAAKAVAVKRGIHAETLKCEDVRVAGKPLNARPAAAPILGEGFLVNPPPCYLPGVTKLRSRPGNCVEISRDGRRGVVASDGRFIPIGVIAGATSYAYPGETVAAAADRCEAACGSESSLSTPGATCSCWHVDKTNWRASRWVSAPSSLAVAAR